MDAIKPKIANMSYWNKKKKYVNDIKDFLAISKCKKWELGAGQVSSDGSVTVFAEEIEK